ncbi:tRNA (uridine(34)/cytosine(34)/5-carboxymethylaminomethyluridine(34)-2'-O)-methyltransferase TrmL [Enterovibrio norvegicus FF-33]|uniref:tRNA (cytidine(34)-2'-O)-methyltransferase n=1 Tax=Enterovibrio norvegicus FF-454 TaxID=1185651 RepID=A0A1E5CFY2_9GAMM|nr:tRNA (cytidine(34)-2'-O)-methyltransferase [Enterovibrio norvegicus]OEE64414.1 tRNA (uridine(34)/cytosine(34)/5-carboxymethylaminomethyluridine(34)-2'-O)-methyltransferase TrmL [Enterovibrio norvegicus FF-454]OEE68804.1 tRNA (uridine(34)/cytosine(34)/5-carboxymethylaminomethyluridine(34)-2'-O)-methyltransferase TrmL [Enterovibrio norvegicus FF-33]OEE89211.1 tRNA (uridine(34)/cytosine(34)/5-carboxymethylaminomethyluridine(34)-2'-O)-methyltransferase TrmL [Enterovibrio norvegicus FF-162]
MFHIVLHEPQIAPNTGNIIRLAANTGCKLHLIEPLGFDFEEKKLRRAGLDYHDLANITRYPNYQAFLDAMHLANEGELRIFACTTKGSRPHSDVSYQAGDIFLFGSETCGLPDSIRDAFKPELRIRVPMMPDSRSLNLANSVSIISYEAWRQLGFVGGI